MDSHRREINKIYAQQSHPAEIADDLVVYRDDQLFGDERLSNHSTTQLENYMASILQDVSAKMVDKE